MCKGGIFTEIQLPPDFAEALSYNSAASNCFYGMSEAEKKSVIEQVRSINSELQMYQLINTLATGGNLRKTATDNQWVSTGIPEDPDNRPRRDGPGGEDASGKTSVT